MQMNENSTISRRELGKRVGTVAAVSALAGVAIPSVHAATPADDVARAVDVDVLQPQTLEALLDRRSPSLLLERRRRDLT